MNYKEHYLQYKHLVDEKLATVALDREPASLYEPTHYILRSGGKRVRAVLVMLACEAVGGTGLNALAGGATVEILHNFTLVHDDIMDSADTRRGRATVHTKWDEGTAILVGDVMIGLAYEIFLESAPKRSGEIVRALSRGIVDVCEGQALDRDYETRLDVTLDDYMHMIAMKTGRLVEMAAEVGGLLGDGTDQQIAALRSYARNIGLAFQIQDDLLDLVADEAELGKEIGKDIVEGKRTYLAVQAFGSNMNGDDKMLMDRFAQENGLPIELVPEVRGVFERHGILDAARQDVERFVQLGITSLEELPTTPARDMLHWFAMMLMNRTS